MRAYIVWERLIFVYVRKWEKYLLVGVSQDKWRGNSAMTWDMRKAECQLSINLHTAPDKYS